MTNYLTAPVTADVYGDDGGIGELMVDAWMSTSINPGASGLTWPDGKHLRSIPRGLFLVFEQGRNATSCVFALKSDPTRDLAGDPEFGLHYLPDDPGGAVYPAGLREFYAPIAVLIDKLAADTTRPLLVRSVEVMTALLDRVAELGIVRAQDFDGNSGELLGIDRDIAADLPGAWRATVAEEMAS